MSIQDHTPFPSRRGARPGEAVEVSPFPIGPRPTATGTPGRISIGEMCQLAGVTHRALRHYEELGLISPQRDTLNVRTYDWQTRNRVLALARMRRAGLSINDVRLLFDVHERGDDVTPIVREKFSQRLRDLRSECEHLEDLMAALDSRAAA